MNYYINYWIYILLNIRINICTQYHLNYKIIWLIMIWSYRFEVAKANSQLKLLCFKTNWCSVGATELQFVFPYIDKHLKF